MKVKIVIVSFLALTLLTGCFGKKDDKESNNDSERFSQAQEQEVESYEKSSTIGGGQGTPSKVQIFRK